MATAPTCATGCTWTTTARPSGRSSRGDASARRTTSAAAPNWRTSIWFRAVCRVVAEITGRDCHKLEALVTFVKDRPGHDFRYAMDNSKLRGELGWKPRRTFQSGLHKRSNGTSTTWTGSQASDPASTASGCREITTNDEDMSQGVLRLDFSVLSVSSCSIHLNRREQRKRSFVSSNPTNDP